VVGTDSSKPTNPDVKLAFFEADFDKKLIEVTS
jgi:hypothetical protein